ncbi:hypothetical protein A2Z67_04815 [Candidatus Woesebacteria bacterium RBG_13_36_22]|uniref:Uncharacterized protein n=1 Tax=Candidatus Woesebacteria bacterium RBG_13_36_22 TaxID=1802478 RepID=A0A1F7X2B5_9BACT|nr:MAG: hypothetical protein A2Z67_04815 [Candidatus Woesebacteria bacterium RBG_13_36_22]
MKHYSLQGHQDTDVISINKTFPAVPKNETDGCGCCWRKFFVLEIDEIAQQVVHLCEVRRGPSFFVAQGGGSQ